MNQVDTQNGKVFPVPVFQKQVCNYLQIPTSISCNYNCIDKFNERYITLQIYNLPPWPHMAKLADNAHVLHIILKDFLQWEESNPSLAATSRNLAKIKILVKKVGF